MREGVSQHTPPDPCRVLDFSSPEFSINLPALEGLRHGRGFSSSHATRPSSPQALAGAARAAPGIVSGDIGTSPLSAVKRAADAGGTLTPESITGTVSLKDAILIMRTDNHGEGGVMAMLALLDVRHAASGS